MFPHYVRKLPDRLPKSIPSDTFPLATDRRMAPRPFSQAWETETNKQKIKYRWTASLKLCDYFPKKKNNNDPNWRDKMGRCTQGQSLSFKYETVWCVSPPGTFPEPCSSLQHREFQWRSACFSGCSPGCPANKQTKTQDCLPKYSCISWEVKKGKSLCVRKTGTNLTKVLQIAKCIVVFQLIFNFL